MLTTNYVALLWGIWLAGWVISSGATAKTVFQAPRTSQLAHSLFVSAGALLLFFHPSNLAPFRHHLFSSPGWVGWLPVALVAIGLGFAGWARYHLGRMWSGRVTLKENHAIIRTGPYAIVRHPIYTGLFVALIGSFLADPTLASVAGLGLLTIGLLIKIGQEEELLTEHFGDSYDSYRRNVSTLIPYVW